MTRELTADMSIGQIAAAHPELIPELERLGVDYCCGGDRSLGIAVSLAGHDVADVIHSLASYRHDAAGGETIVDCASMSMTELADHIEATHHVYARESLARLHVLLEKCVIAHGQREPRLLELRTVVVSLAEDMHDHLVREERVLFPWLRRLERPSEIQSGPPWSVRRPIDCMIHDHDDVGAAFARILELTDDLNPPEGACATWRECYRLLGNLERDTHLHIHKENNVLFPAGIAAESALGRGPGVPRPAGRGARSGFTLIELLVVIAIMAMLIGITLPGAGRAAAAGRSVVCLANTRSIATAMMLYADNDQREFFPTARMPSMPMGDMPAAPFQMSWIYQIAPYVGVEMTLPDNASPEQVREFVEAMEVCRCPDDHSQNWGAMMMPRLASYGISAYLTPNHPPHWGVRASQIFSPARCVLAAELSEEMGTDHFMPMYWGDPPAVVHSMMQMRQWDAATQLPKVIQHTRHVGERANYVFADGHAGAHAFSDTWDQNSGLAPRRNWYDPHGR